MQLDLWIMLATGPLWHYIRATNHGEPDGDDTVSFPVSFARRLGRLTALRRRHLAKEAALASQHRLTAEDIAKYRTLTDETQIAAKEAQQTLLRIATEAAAGRPWPVEGSLPTTKLIKGSSKTDTAIQSEQTADPAGPVPTHAALERLTQDAASKILPRKAGGNPTYEIQPSDQAAKTSQPTGKPRRLLDLSADPVEKKAPKRAGAAPKKR